MDGRGIRGISFSIGGFFQGCAEIELECEQGAWKERHRRYPAPPGGGPGWSAGRQLSGGEAAALEAALGESGALGWEKEYWSPVLDGEQWSLEARFADGSKLESGGSNRWPAGFDALFAQLVRLGLPEEFEGREDDPLNLPESE